ncbi:lipopolysaccharide biosynthesis protein RfbH [Rickettsiales bacterium]|nr:lipopolysaccharide biosynthesis protein RfbH [Rickettsiales bacterium]
MKDINSIKKDIFELVNNYSDIKFSKKEFLPGITSIPAAGKYLDNSEMINMVDACLDGWLTTGRFNAEFETKLANFLEVKSLFTVNSGSSANLVSFSALTSPKLKERAIKEGDEIITVAAGFPTTVNPLLLYKTIPVFIDVKLGNYNIDENQIESAITNKTKAIVLAHTLGNPFNLGVIKSICEKYKLWLIEDTCDALGAKYNNQKVGTFGDFGTLSFYPAHHITMGEGGAVFTNNPILKRIAESFRDWGRDCFCGPGEDNSCKRRFCWQLGDLPKGYDHKYTYSHAGFNFKITDMQAACGLAQLGKLEKFIETRNKNFDYLFKKMIQLEEFFVLPQRTKLSEPSWFGFPLTIRNHDRISRKELTLYLEERRIGTRLLFGGNLTKQPYFKKIKYRINNNLVNSDKITQDTFWVGIHPSLDKNMLDYIYESINSFLKKNV